MNQPNQIPPDDLTELPLFPLNLVLFPGMRLPLHIFEERYKAMIGDCIDRETPFGVVLIKEGPEVGGPAEPFRIGTSARVTQVQRLEEGRMNLLALGERRFDLVEIVQEEPHMVGRIAYKEEAVGELDSQVLSDVGQEYGVFLQHIATLAGAWNAPVEVPENPLNLSFEAVSTLTGSIELPQGMRQDLLEVETASERLSQLLPLLKRANELISEQVDKNNPYRGPRLN
ncbi:MAG: LON peptidase substrate-binding domain-containing protein [Chloroflexi bacterium]|nr:LON peptidase substrate-binding domain-containing protein [Chloroflexota bacterium]